MENLQIGQIFYKYLDNDELDIVRVHSTHKGLIVSRGINKKRVDDDFLNGYTPLRPHGRLFFNIVNMGPTTDHGQDVIIVLIKEEDIHSGIYEPYAVCRQNIYDEYSNPFNISGKEILGMSMNRDNVPTGARFQDMLSSHSVDYHEVIYVYKDDKIDIILSMIKEKLKYNRVLFDIYKTLSKTNRYDGLSKSLEDLVKSTNFNFDLKKAFDITIIDEVLKIKDNKLLDESRLLLENIFKVEMFQTYVMRYNYEIDLSNIKRDYELVEDKIGNLYIVGYDKGAYINTYIDKNKTILDAMIGGHNILSV